jgi:hypothetical protein
MYDVMQQISQKFTILCGIPAVRAASSIHYINKATTLNGITVLLSVIAARVPEMVKVPQKSPPFTAAF